MIGEEYSLTDDFFKSKDVIFEIVDLLNVMNDTLLKQAKENHKLSNENGEQQATINELQAKLQEKEQDEKLYANEILELREINKEWLQCKNLGGDY